MNGVHSFNRIHVGNIFTQNPHAVECSLVLQQIVAAAASARRKAYRVVTYKRSIVAGHRMRISLAGRILCPGNGGFGKIGRHRMCGEGSKRILCPRGKSQARGRTGIGQPENRTGSRKPDTGRTDQYRPGTTVPAPSVPGAMVLRTSSFCSSMVVLFSLMERMSSTM